MGEQAYIDTLIDGNGNYYYPETKEKAISDDDGVYLPNKISKFGALIDCDCEYSEPDSAYILNPINLSVDLPSIFSVRFKTPNDYINGADFILKNEKYILTSTFSSQKPTNIFVANVVLTLDCLKDTDNLIFYK